MTDTNAEIKSLTMELQIEASPANVWQALTESIGAWWPNEFYAGGSQDERQFSLDATPGGLMLETWDTGGGVLWGSVIGADPGKTLQVLGHTFPNWGGPNQWYGTWTLAEVPGGTKLAFSESVVGRVSEDGIEEKDKGWRFLWQTLKAHVEGQSPPVWDD